MFEFVVVPGNIVDEILTEKRNEVADVVRETYLLHEQKQTINPDSYFLRFPDKPNSRIIALPAKIGGHVGKAGIKWISSFPDNVGKGVPRASAVLILNDYETGYPVACLESAGISASRTAASAAVATRVLLEERGASDGGTLSFVGAGVIARTIFDHLVGPVLSPTRIRLFDLDRSSTDQFASYVRQTRDLQVEAVDDLSSALTSDVVVLATTAAEPHIPESVTFRPDQLVLNISLRDLPPSALLDTNNVVDDVDHCLKANTSPHLAEQLSGGRDFITGTIGQVLMKKIKCDPSRATVFSPFGLGVLDLAVGDFVLGEAVARGGVVPIDNFFGSTVRW